MDIRGFTEDYFAESPMIDFRSHFGIYPCASYTYPERKIDEGSPYVYSTYIDSQKPS